MGVTSRRLIVLLRRVDGDLGIGSVFEMKTGRLIYYRIVRGFSRALGGINVGFLRDDPLLGMAVGLGSFVMLVGLPLFALI